MKSINIGLLSLSFIVGPSMSFAFFCPTNFNQIELGNDMNFVMQQCGKPDFQQEEKKPNENIPQEWSYYISQNVTSPSMAQAQGTIKTQVTFDSNGKAINISVNGIGVRSSPLCGTSIAIGNSRDTVKAACGEPSFVNKQSPTGSVPAEVTLTILIYNSTPPTKLIFENGRLIQKQ